MPNFNAGDAVDLLDGGEVVAKGRIINVDPNSTIHGEPMPVGHLGVSVVRSLKGTVYIPYGLPHEPELSMLADVEGYIIAWPRVALVYKGTVLSGSHSWRSHSRSSRRSHSSSSSRGSRGSKYSSMSEEEFEAEARRRGFQRKERSEKDVATSKGCFDSCFGRSSRREELGRATLETVYEDSDQNFEFRPNTQLQFDEPLNRFATGGTPSTTEPSTPLGAQTPYEGTASTPVETPPATPFQQTLCYDIDEDGSIVSNTKGKRVISRMHELMWIYFPDDILTDWRLQPIDSKRVVKDQLHREFPNPEGYRFTEKVIYSLMNHVLKSPRGTARVAYDSGSIKPPGISTDDWKRVQDERRTFPNKWEQQREANRVQRFSTGLSRLGSGGKAHFMARFEEVMGRKPTDEEYKEGKSISLAGLLQRMKADGIVIPDRATQQRGDGAGASATTGPNVEMESEEEDVTYVPSSQEESEDEIMESEVDADIWLKDVDHPTSSRRPKGRR